MTNFKNTRSLFSHIKKEMAKSMRKDLAPIVKEIESQKVKEEVYDKYKPGTDDGEPWEYERRKDKGGLSAKKNMKHAIKRSGNDVTLTVDNVTTEKDGDMRIAEVVEYGDDAGYGEYDFKSNRDGTAKQYLQPRPFTEKTIEEIKNTDIHTKTLKNSLKAKGFDVK